MYFQTSLILVISCSISVLGIDYDGTLNLRMEHSLGCSNGQQYCHRGTISVKSIRSEIAVIDQSPLTEAQYHELKQLANDDGIYTIKTIVTSTDNKQTELLSSTKAQMFLESELSDSIVTWVLPNGGVMAINFQPDNSTKYNSLVNNKDYHINSKFFLRHVEQGPVPDTASYIQKLERERDASEKGEMKDNRSFLAKYWMYIVPIVIFFMISGATNQEAAAGQPAR